MYTNPSWRTWVLEGAEHATSVIPMCTCEFHTTCTAWFTPRIVQGWKSLFNWPNNLKHQLSTPPCMLFIPFLTKDWMWPNCYMWITYWATPSIINKAPSNCDCRHSHYIQTTWNLWCFQRLIKLGKVTAVKLSISFWTSITSFKEPIKEPIMRFRWS